MPIFALWRTKRTEHIQSYRAGIKFAMWRSRNGFATAIHMEVMSEK